MEPVIGMGPRTSSASSPNRLTRTESRDSRSCETCVGRPSHVHVAAPEIGHCLGLLLGERALQGRHFLSNAVPYLHRALHLADPRHRGHCPAAADGTWMHVLQH